MGFFLIPDEKDNEIAALSLAFPDGKCYFVKRGELVSGRYLGEKLGRLSERTKLACKDVKQVFRFVENDSTEPFFDVILGAYLLNPLKNDYCLEDVANEHLGLTIKGQAELFGKMSLSAALASMPQEVSEYACFMAYTAGRAAPVIRQKLSEAGIAVRAGLHCALKSRCPLPMCSTTWRGKGSWSVPESSRATGRSFPCG